MDTGSETEQIEELLELGRYMGPGERYLMLYEGVLRITNRTGFARWPRGNRRTIAIFDAANCVCGLNRGQWSEIMGRLPRIRRVDGAGLDDRHRREYGQAAEQVPQAHPT